MDALAFGRRCWNRTAIDTFITVENRDALFPIHRGLKFLLLTATRGPRRPIPCRSGIQSATDLERLPDLGNDEAVELPRSVVERFAATNSPFPRFEVVPMSPSLAARYSSPAALVSGRMERAFWPGAERDRRQAAFRSPGGSGCLPVLEGKQIQPFVAHANRVTRYIAEPDAARLPVPRAISQGLAWRIATWHRRRIG